MTTLKLSRSQITDLVQIFSRHEIAPKSDCQKMALGIVEDFIITPLQRKLLSQSNSFSLRLKDYQKIALLQYLQSIETTNSYEWVQLYKLADSAGR
jgi:hypothetical protein